VLGCLPERDRQELLRWSAIRTLGERKRIFRQGDPGRTVLVVLAGHVKLSLTTADGREVVLEIVYPGGCFGELAVLNNCPRAADATTISRCRLLAIDGRQFLEVMGRSLEGLQAVVEAGLQCQAARDGARIELQMSQAELGGLTGLTRESVCKQMAALREAGLISQSEGCVTLLDIAALGAVSGVHDDPGPGSSFCRQRLSSGRCIEAGA
jgi:CRP/FNR family transcriptional regulator, cyclic AMP receptor protein